MPAKTIPRARRDPLKTYRQKRDFSRTAEPAPQVAKGQGWQFVVQKHAARRLHYDLRLELDGVLLSWAVTRGPSLVPGEKRLAVHTEDHPMKYLEFEGVIPQGEYGAGTMIVWDRGTWTPEGDPHKALKKGHLDFTLDGKRLKGRWHLIRMRPRPKEKKEQWLLIKGKDEHAREPDDPDLLEQDTTSVLSGRTNAQLAQGDAIREDHAARAKVAKTRKVKLPDAREIPGVKKGILPPFVDPSLAQLATRAPSGNNWVHEIKFDGYRTQARIDGPRVQLLTRKGLDWTERFRGIAATLKKLKLGSALLDGEIVSQDGNGASSFSDLQVDLKSGRDDRLVYYVFDLLYLEGVDLRGVSLLERKSLLQTLLQNLPADANVRLSEHLDEDGKILYEHACRLGLEGIVSKRRDQPYRSGRGDHWLKTKCANRQEFAIIGYVPSTAVRHSVGSLVLGYYDNGKLIYAGRAGTGLTGEVARSLRNELEKINVAKPAFGKKPPAGTEKGVRWAEPRLVAEIEFRGWTHDGVLRQAAYKGLRDDKAPAEIVREAEMSPAKDSGPSGKTPVAKAKAGGGTVAKPEFAGVRLTHPDKILFDEQGVTKQGLAEFYIDIADWILPHLVRRPLSLVRCPSGASAKCFYAKHAWAGLNEAIKPVDTGDGEPMLAIDNLKGLIGLVQAGVLEIHPWGSTVDSLDRPDRLIIDLDPGDDLGWEAVVDAAKETRQRLKDLGLVSFVKTSGGKGLHVVIPLDPRADWDTAKAFTKSIADAMSADTPERYVATMAKKLRTRRIFVDYLRNGRGATAVAAYSTRVKPGATVSVPLAWSELSDAIRSDHFNVDNLRQRLDHLKRDPWRELFTVRQRLPSAAGGKRQGVKAAARK